MKLFPVLWFFILTFLFPGCEKKEAGGSPAGGANPGADRARNAAKPAGAAPVHREKNVLFPDGWGHDTSKITVLDPAPGSGFFRKIDLKGALPEEFDWQTWFEEGDQSTGGEMISASTAAKVMQMRIDELSGRYRDRFVKGGDAEVLKRFDEMQEHWKKSADAEVSLVGSAWDGGSGAKVAYPMQRFRVNLRRVKELRSLRGDCMYLNE